MSNTFRFTLAALALSLFGLSAAPASAFPPLIQPGIDAGAVSPLASQVKHGHATINGNWAWNGGGYRNWHGNGYRNWHGNGFYPRPYYRHRYYGNPCYGWYGPNCGAFYGGPFIGLGFGFGPNVYAYPRRQTYRHASRHVAWCENRYRSYNPRTNTWVAYSGRVRQCISPYGP